MPKPLLLAGMLTAAICTPLKAEIARASWRGAPGEIIRLKQAGVGVVRIERF